MFLLCSWVYSKTACKIFLQICNDCPFWGRNSRILHLSVPSLRVHNGHNRGHSFWEQVLVINVGLFLQLSILFLIEIKSNCLQFVHFHLCLNQTINHFHCKTYAFELCSHEGSHSFSTLAFSSSLYFMLKR